MSTFDRTALKKARKRHAKIRRQALRSIVDVQKRWHEECIAAALKAAAAEELVALYEITRDDMHAARRLILNRLASLCSTPEELQDVFYALPRRLTPAMNPIRKKWERLCLKALRKADTQERLIEFLKLCPPDQFGLREVKGLNWRETALYQGLAKLLNLLDAGVAFAGLRVDLRLWGIENRTTYDESRLAALYKERRAAA